MEHVVAEDPHVMKNHPLVEDHPVDEDPHVVPVVADHQWTRIIT